MTWRWTMLTFPARGIRFVPRLPYHHTGDSTEVVFSSAAGPLPPTAAA